MRPCQVAVFAVLLGLSAGFSALGSALSVSPTSISDVIGYAELESASPWFDLELGGGVPATTAVSINVTQTGSWAVSATVALPVDAPGGADAVPASALQFSVDGVVWLASGGTIGSGGCSSPPCSASIDVRYRLDLSALGNGAVGNYVFRVRFALSAPDGSFEKVVQLTVTASAVVSIVIYSQPSPVTSTVSQADLAARYFRTGGDLARFTVRVFAISDWEVSAAVASLSGYSGGQAGTLLQGNVSSVSTDDEGCIENMVGWQTLPMAPASSSAIFTGCNTMSGTAYSTVRLAVRMDLASLGDCSSGVAVEIRLTVTIVET
jgi:hypothetical protein